jgi:phospholipid/cholesterol/gamma-HCH transport system substrate-binding protein
MDAGKLSGMARHSWAEIGAGALVLVAAAGFLTYAVGQSGRTAGAGYALTARFDRIDGLAPGSDVRLAGVRVGRVEDMRVDPRTYLAQVTFRLDSAVRLPRDSSAEITSDGLLGGRYVALVPGGDERMLADGAEITNTQSAVSLEALLGRFIFSVTELVGSQRPANPPAAP